MTRIAVVGIGADGWPGLGERRARRDPRARATIFGSERQLALLPAEAAGERRTAALAAGATARRARRSPGRRLHPRQRRPDAPRHRRLARPPARPGAPRRPPASLRLRAGLRAARLAGRRRRAGQRRRAPGGRRRPRARSPAAGSSSTSPARTARARSRASSPSAASAASRLVVLEQLGAPGERVTEATAQTLRRAAPTRCTRWRSSAGDPGTPLRALVPGLPDDAYETDGQLTKRHVRAITLAALAPAPGALLWDVGAGSGSIGIEWLRAEPTAARDRRSRPDAARADRIERNALRPRRPRPADRGPRPRARGARRPRRARRRSSSAAASRPPGCSTPAGTRWRPAAASSPTP